MFLNDPNIKNREESSDQWSFYLLSKVQELNGNLLKLAIIIFANNKNQIFFLAIRIVSRNVPRKIKSSLFDM